VPVPDDVASREPEAAAAEARASGLPATAAGDVGAALRGIAAHAGAPARVLVCGSLYLAGHVLRENA